MPCLCGFPGSSQPYKAGGLGSADFQVQLACLGTCKNAGGGLYPPSPAGRLSPGLPMLEGRAGPLPEWAYPSALWEEFSRDRNKVSQDPRLCSGCRDILLSPSPIWLHVGQDIQGFGTQEEVASDGKSQQQGLYFSTTPSQPWGQGQGDMS